MTITAALAASTQSFAQALPQGLLARPITPGSVALLVLDVRSPEVQQRLSDALRDERPAIRSVAARVVAVSASAGQAAALAEALAKETDPIAAREEARALMVVGGEDRDRVLAEAANRLGGSSALLLAEGLARARGADIVTALPSLLARSKDADALVEILSIVVLERPGERRHVAEGVLAVEDAAFWRAYLAMLDGQQIAVETSTWLAGLGSPKPEVHAATLFAIAAGLAEGEKFAASVVDTARPTGAWPPATPTEADYARELVARITGDRPTSADWASVVNGLGVRLPFVLWSRMTDAERDAARAAGFGRGDMGTGAGYQRPPRNPRGAAGPPARIARPFVPGLFAEMAALTDCRLGNDTDYAAAQVAYRPDGRPEQVSLVKTSIPKRCTPFVSAAMSLLVARADHAIAVEPSDVVFLPLQSSMLACIDRAMGAPLEPGLSGVTMPELQREQKPKYTPDAMKARVEGAVRLKAIVSEDGCVSQAEVQRPLYPGLDLEALNAVLQWRFKPSLLNGQPVPVRITVEVGFHLRR